MTNISNSSIIKVLQKLKIKKGDNVLVNSNILRLILNKKNKKKKINFIKILKKKITKKGNLFFPTYSWDFCKYKKFNYKETKTVCGALSNMSLLDKDFIRTKNPIFSFAVFGKNKKKIASIPHKDCFGMNSPFGYLIKNNGKNLFIDLDYKKANTFVHLAEQIENVKYRYKKVFSGIYIDNFKKKKKIKIKMFVRKSYVNSTIIKKEFDKILKKKKLIKSAKIKNINFSVLNIPLTFNCLREEIKKKSGLITYN